MRANEKDLPVAPILCVKIDQLSKNLLFWLYFILNPPLVAVWSVLKWTKTSLPKIWSIIKNTVQSNQRFGKEQIGVKEPFPVTNLPFP